MKKILSGMLASSLILSMGTVSHASTMEDRLDNIFGMIDLVNGLNGETSIEETPDENTEITPEATPETTPEENPEETPEVTPETTPDENTVPNQSYEAETDPRPKVAEPSSAKVMVNGEVVPFAAYTIEGFNYFRLTDVSYALSGTSRQFEVTWDDTVGAINMLTERPHLVLGTELLGNSGQEETALRFFAPVYKDGEEMVVTVYTIDGASYFKLDSLMVALDLNVGWDGETGTITITA